MYKTLNRLLGQQKDIIFPTHKDPQTVANEMGWFFSEKITKIRRNISSSGASPASYSAYPQHDETLTMFSNLSPDDVKQLVLDMNSKSCSLDPIPTWLLKECLEELLPIITHIINTSLDNSTFPNFLRHATITPNIKNKNGDTEVYTNYRPISNTPFLAKLLEKAALVQINQHIDSAKLHSEVQSGYRKYHSCETATLKIVNDIKENVVRGEITALLLLDLSAAFDTVDHSILLERLNKSYGIKGGVIKWLKTYLSNRTYSVHINGYDSEKINMQFGVLQGTILGPL